MDYREHFFQTYREQLELAVNAAPEEYLWYTPGNVESINATARLMGLAFERQSFNKDSRAVKATCKALGIRHTYKAIQAYRLTGEVL